MNLDSYRGRILDADAHLQLPLRVYPEMLGAAGETIHKGFAKMLGGSTAEMKTHFDPDAEEPHNDTNIWKVKGAAAPGATTALGRLETLDMMGIDRQLNFPQVLVCFAVWGRSPRAERIDAMRRYNDYAIEWSRASQGRVRSVGVVMVDDLAEACSEAERIVEAGIDSVFLPEGTPIGGLSPAHPDNDPFWKILADGNVPALLHIGGGIRYTREKVWGQTALLSSGGVGAGETVNPHMLSTVHQAAENYVIMLTLGGVFQRVPNLRFGAIELGATWVGPMAERMDVICDMRMGKDIRAFDLRPSEFLARNFRATPFITEDIGKMIERHPNLEDVYCFSTDFPHPEGGTNPLGVMSKSIERLGSATLEKFLVTNSELLMPA
jgi:predicted TIM-barrel fold metal-dependent hydrolase